MKPAGFAQAEGMNILHLVRRLGWTALLSVALTACVSNTTVSDTTTSTSAAVAVSSTSKKDAATATSASSSNNEALRQDLDDAFTSWFEHSTSPGASLAVQLSDGSVLSFSAGVTNMETGEPVTADSVFRIASISKSITAAAVVDLVEEGLVDLDEKVDHYLGEGWVGDQPYASDITVRDLLAHTSGLVEYAFNPAFAGEAQQRYGRAWEPDELLEFVGRQGAESRPGERFSYNTGGFIAAGLLLEEVTGEPAVDVFRTRIFDPSHAQSIGLAPQVIQSPNHVSGYVTGDYRNLMISLDPESDKGLTLDNGTPVLDVLSTDQATLRSSSWTGGGVEATMASTAAVWHAIFDGTLLGGAAIEELTNQPTPAGYGLGVMLGRSGGSDVYSHSGVTAGFRSQAGYVASSDSSFAVSVNTGASGHAIDSLASIVTAILATA